MIEIAKKAAIEAGKKITLLRRKGLSFKGKKRLGDFATDADTLSEKIILDMLQREFPKHNFVSEESGTANRGSEYTWVIDPLDGTIPFSSGLPIFGVSIGLLKKHGPVLGVINLPEQGWLFWAEKGKGAFMNAERLVVSGKKELMKCVVGVEYGYMGTRGKEAEKLLIPLVDKVRYPPALGSSVAGCAYVAKGVLDGYIHSAHPWDFAAGALIVAEAGGKVTDYEGKPVDWTKDWIDFFASNGQIHDEILSLIKP